MDAAGEMLLRDVTEPSLSAAARSTAVRLISNYPDDEVVLGLSAPDDLIRLVPLEGNGRPCYAVFVEKLATRSPVDAACRRFGLSERERDVLPHVLRGESTAEIAGVLMIAESTFATHVRNIGAKMNASKRKEIVAAVLGGR